MSAVAALAQTVLGIAILALGVAGLHAILARSARAGTSRGNNSPGAHGSGERDRAVDGSRVSSPLVSRSDPPANIAALLLLTVAGLMVGSLVVAAVGHAGNPLAYDLLFGAVAVALAAVGGLRPATVVVRLRERLPWYVECWRPAAWTAGGWRTGPRRAALLVSVPVLILALAIGLSWWSDETTTNEPVTALGAVRTQSGLAVTVTRADSDSGDLTLEVINSVGRHWRTPLAPDRDKVDVAVENAAVPAPTTIHLLAGEKIIQSITIP
ncbi:MULTISPECIES: hypothetical protein [Protofrankia]|uniref:Uncharacterized protein n=1 Tax=Candidatus Protofrankia datiscae TaxID=2716812 RepID=F8AWD1_9ACTN|nr:MULTISPECIES: hypothetical protein [Protofrankia]AEH08332.1 hypothetical protein FsymDg_0820 [Candidatus Protofrankia datiscae]